MKLKEEERNSAPPPTDDALVQSFLAGDYCLYGGAGWWKHEYCHGRQVIQFHEDAKTGERQTAHYRMMEHYGY